MGLFGKRQNPDQGHLLSERRRLMALWDACSGLARVIPALSVVAAAHVGT